MNWRSIARPLVAKCVREIGLSDRKALNKALRDAYPFGERAYHPYKVWLSEIKNQCGGIRRSMKRSDHQDLFDAEER